MNSSFYQPVDPATAEASMSAYMQFLEQRNGTLDYTVSYPRRDAWLDESTRWDGTWDGISREQFEHNYTRFDPATAPTAAEALLLAFVKANASEAYGIEVVNKHRQKAAPHNDFARLERILGREEHYHTRILLGATAHFGLPPPESSWRPPFSQKLLINTLAYAPTGIYHPVLLGAEISGVFLFTWMLNKVGEVFASAPVLREALERRLVEILIDEIGHIAFNRMAVGGRGLAVARRLAPLIVEQTAGRTPEFRALGWTDTTPEGLAQFDWPSLPEEVRRHAFFV